MNIPSINIKDYTYYLPEEKIAKYPLKDRSDSKLLIYDNGITESTFASIPKRLPANSLTVFNNTKVIQARIPFKKETGSQIEIFCLEPYAPADLNLAFQAKNEISWKCIVGNSKKWKNGFLVKDISHNDKEIVIKAKRELSLNDAQVIQFSWNDSEISFGEILDAIGKTPIPPYLKRDSEILDIQRYQTVYSYHKGSVAAPTAGLHFTDDILNQLHANKIETAYITLHVGAGTFKPVKSETIEGHEMHIEHFAVDKKTIELLIKYQGNITSTGTTTVRTLESLYWIGVKFLEGKKECYINQWEAYNLPQHYTTSESLQALIEHFNTTENDRIEGYTGILIAPGYSFKVVNNLVTNFHQPNSTLLLLIAAFTGGDKWKEIYNYALNHDFRFLSYGDSSLIFGK